MMRRGGASTQRPMQEQFGNGTIPPSTIAAQIVSNAVNSQSHHEPEKNVVFRQLLQEYLNDPSTDEANAQLNTQLISVVAEAGLDGLLQENPFGLDALIPQAIDSLAVIKLTIQRRPQLLLSSLSEGDDSSSQPLLFIWLFPKLLGLLGHPNLEHIQLQLQDLLVTCVRISFQTSDLLEQAASILQLYQSCIDSILIALRADDPLAGAFDHSFKVLLPPSSSISTFWPESEQIVVLPQGTQRTITSKQQAVLIALTLIEVLLATGKSAQDYTISFFCEKYLPFIIDSFSGLWRYCQERITTKDRIKFHDDAEGAFLRILESAFVVSVSTNRYSAPSVRTAFFLSRSLSDVLLACCTAPFSKENQFQLASLLFQVGFKWTSSPGYQNSNTGRTLETLIMDSFGPTITRVCQNLALFNALHKDLQIALCLLTAPCDWPEEVSQLRSSLCSEEPLELESEQLQTELGPFIQIFRQLNVGVVDGERPTKRRKTDPAIDQTNHQTVYNELVGEITASSTSYPAFNLPALHNFMAEEYVARDEAGRCELLVAFGKVACAGSRCLQISGEVTNLVETYNYPCRLCDGHQKHDSTIANYWNESGTGEDWKDTIAALLTITQVPEFQKSTKPRVLMALAIGRIFNHISSAEYLDLEHCSLGQWCLASLSRSIRELRIAAGRALSVFLRNDVPKPVRRRNRIGALDFLQTLTRRGVLSEQETIIMAYGEVARVCGEDELPIILLQLVEYLGHPNAFVCGVAYNELHSIAEASSVSTGELFRPFWRSIGPAVIKDLQNLPQKAQQLSDLLGLSVNQMLLMTQTETLPHLVLTKRKDVLQRIATARGTSIQDICTQPRRNLACILALLLCQGVPHVEESAMEALAAVAPAFHENDNNLASWIKLEPVLVACELLKSAAEENELRKPHVYSGFNTLAALSEMKPGQKRVASKKKTLSSFFENHILGIIAHFSDVLDNHHEVHPISERRRCVGAIGEMINLAESHVTVALPQIRACLQSAMQNVDLCDQTFLVWSALLKVVEEEDLGYLVDQTFALIVQNWSHFSEETHRKAYDIIGDLIKTHNNLLKERIDSLPSLASIPMMQKFDGEISRLKAMVQPESYFLTFSRRCDDENSVVVSQALSELVPYLEVHQRLLHDSAISDKPSRILSVLMRSLLDASVRFAEDHPEVSVQCARCLGIIGCLDPHRVEAVREKREMLVLSNFERATEVIDFSSFFLERVLVKVFYATTNARAQGFLAYVMQEMLRFCGFNQIAFHRVRSSQPSIAFQKWMEIPESVRSTLTPFLNSKYMVRSNAAAPTFETYPIFSQYPTHSEWLRAFVFDLLHRGKGENPQMIFPVLAKIIKGHDLSISSFILPFAALNVVVSGEDKETADIGQEFLTVLQAEILPGDHDGGANIKQCSENIFQVLDYFAHWLQEKRKAVAEARSMAGKTGRGISEMEELKDISQISCVERILQSIPAEVISRRAVECGSYARALFHWEQYMRQERKKHEQMGKRFVQDELLEHLQFIYAQIDEPDSIEGISAHLRVLNPEQQIMEHRKAGRWTAAQSWYELSLTDKPDDPEAQVNLLTCLKESGQYDSILNYVHGFQAASNCSSDALPFAAEAAWSTGKWDQLERIMTLPSEQAAQISSDFKVGIGKALLALRQKRMSDFGKIIASLREGVARGLSPTLTASIHASHDSLMKLHVLHELETISGLSNDPPHDRKMVLEHLDRRLDILGAYISDKQYLLGIRRAAMQLSGLGFTDLDIASAWLTSASLARKANFSPTAYHSVLRAAQLGDDASKIEYSKLLWKDGHHRKAIQILEGAIASNAFQAPEPMPNLPLDTSMSTVSTVSTVNLGNSGKLPLPNKVLSHAQLLYAKWLDRAGQTKSTALREHYARGVVSFARWDKGHYYLGRFYNKLFESEKILPVNQQSLRYRSGENSKLIIENYTRSLVYGTKYYYQTIPKILTLWLDLGMLVAHPPKTDEKNTNVLSLRRNFLDHINKHIARYTNDRVPAYAWYTAFPQIITRISHPHPAVWDSLQVIIVKVASNYPQQALWSLLAVPKSTARDRAARGYAVLNKLKTIDKRKGNLSDLKLLITQGQRLSDALLEACEIPVESRITHVSLSKDLSFSMKLAPCDLVVPIEATMIPNLPGGHDSKVLRLHNPFPNDAVTIASFADDVLVLSSLQRPRKINIRGSDGHSYGLLCKPKDDLRKDQRLMEFNAMINRALQRDIESSKRRLYIPTYGVTPLNEECGTIEWVEGLKPMRDIIIRLYRQKGIHIDYAQIRTLLNEASSTPEKLPIFSHKILKQFPPVLHEWFTEQFPDPAAWFAARLRYTRSCAVMSIVGHVLGLGDRHGENVLLEEGNGGTFHVDFNCLFDKGLTFEKPELVPFRLTHNMVDAFGPAGVEGAFRRAAELTYSLCRQHEDTLITVLETFVHDPTADFLGGKRKRKVEGVPDTPQEVLESVRGKLSGMVKGDSVPLSVEGYVEGLIQMARDEWNLASMYIGWCAFF